MNEDLQKKIDQNALSMRKGLIEYSVMLICANEPVYVGEIVSRLRSVDMIVVEGTLYPLLSRLASEHLMSYAWKESDSGPPRKYYELTTGGITVLDAYKTQWKSLRQTIERLDEGEAR